MKKMILPALLIAAFTISCNVEKIDSSRNDNIHEVNVVINAAPVESKTYISYEGGEYVPYWNANDAMWVDVATVNNPKEFKAASAGLTASFSGSVSTTDGDHTIYAFMPKRSSRVSEGVYKFNGLSNQTIPSLSTFDSSADLIIANPEVLSVSGGGKTVTIDGMRFYRLKGIIKVILVDATTDAAKSLAGKKVKKVTLTSSDAILDAKVTVNLTSGEITNKESKLKTLSASYSGDDWTINGSNGAYILSLPATLTSGTTLNVSVETDDESLVISKTVTLSKDIEIKANAVKPLKVNLTDDSITIISLDPEINAANVSLNADATAGSITYSVTNPVSGGVMTAALKEASDWLTVGAVSDGSVALTCSANTGAARSAVVTLTYTYNDPAETVNKDVTVSQAAAGAPSLSTYTWDFTADKASTSFSASDSGTYQYTVGSQSSTFTSVSSTNEYQVLYACPSGKTLKFENKGTFTVLSDTSGAAAYLLLNINKKGSLTIWATLNKKPSDTLSGDTNLNVIINSTEVPRVVSQRIDTSSTEPYLGAGEYSWTIDGTSSPASVEIHKSGSHGLHIFKIVFAETE